MHHPFELTISELEKVNFEIEKVSDEDLEKVSGGKLTVPLTTRALGEEGGRCGFLKTTYALGEEGGRRLIFF